MIGTEKITYKSNDGRTDIAAVCYVPDCAPRAVLQIAHGMVEHKERYDGYARYMAERGFAVCINDHLGHGESVTDDSELGYMTKKAPARVLIEDIHALRKIVSAKYPDVPYFMLGHSMGSYLLRMYLANYGDGIAAAVIMGTGHMPVFMPVFGLTLTTLTAAFRGWHYRSEFIRQITYDKYYQKYDLDGKDKTNSWLTKDKLLVERYYSDPKCGFIFTLSGYKALFGAVLASVTKKGTDAIPHELPLLITSGADDPVGGCGKCVTDYSNLLKKTGHTDVTLKLYSGARHEILNETNRDEVYGDIYSWFSEYL